MGSARRPRPRTLAVGAYERDNFGDLLYLELMRTHTGHQLDLTFAAPIGADMTEIFGQVIPAAAPLLESTNPDVIWTVGGEVGSATLPYVYRTAFGDEASGRLATLGGAAQRELLRRATEGVLYDSPYIPRPSAHGRNRAVLVLNSVGIGGVATATGARKVVLESTLRESSFLSVRDCGSHDALEALGIPHRLAPDLAHTLPGVHHVQPSTEQYALIHVPELAVTEFGLEAWASALASSADLARLPIRLFIAGTAPGHDRVETAERLRDALAQKTGWSVEVSSSRGVWARVDEIAQASLWVGGSLHGRVVSAAYRVPRVSFRSWKVDQYARTWDDDYPSGVTPDTVRTAIGVALSTAPRADVDELGEQALISIRAAVEAACNVSSQSTYVEYLDRLLEVRRAEAEELHELASGYERTALDANALERDVVHFREDRNRWREEAHLLREDRERWKLKFETARADREKMERDAGDPRAE